MWSMEKIMLGTKFGRKRPNPQHQFVEDIISFINEK